MTPGMRSLDEHRGLNCAVRRLTPPPALPLEELLAGMRGQAQARSQGGESYP